VLCITCGAANPEGSDVRFCRACGAELARASALIGSPRGDADGYSAAPANGQVTVDAPILPIAAPVAPFAALIPTVAPAPGMVHVAVSPYGGFWIRLVARMIDEVILLGTQIIALFTLGLAIAIVAGDAGVEAGLPSSTWWLVSFAVAIPYRWLFPPLLGGTPGKLMLGYHIVDDEGRHIGLKQSFGRMLAQMLSALVLGLGFIWIAFDSHKQGWYDQIAATFVVRKELVKPSSRGPVAVM